VTSAAEKPGPNPELPLEVVFGLAFEATSDLMAIIRVAPDGRLFVERFNRSAREFFGHAFPQASPADWQSADMASVLRHKAGLSAEKVDKLLAPHREAVMRRAIVNAAAEIHTSSGAPLRREFVMTPIQDRNGKVTHLFYRDTDLTELRHAEERSEVMFQASPIPTSVTTLDDGRILDVNAAWLRLYGLKREDVLGRSVAQLGLAVVGGERDRMVASLAEVGQARNFMAKFRVAGGRIAHRLVSAHRTIWSGTDAVVIATQEATELEEARRAAEETGQRFATLFELTPLPLSIVRRRDDQRLAANAAWLRFHGKTAEQAIGRPTTQPSVWADPAQREAVISRLYREGRLSREMVRLRPADGSVRNVLISAERIDWQGEECFVTATLDVSALEAARERVEQILAASPVSISITSFATGRYVFVNAAWSRIFGYTRDEAQAISAGTSGFWASAEERVATFAPLREGREVQVARRYRRPDGAEADLMLVARQIEFDGEVCVLAVTQDVTETERARRDAQTSAERFTKLFELSPVPIVIGRLSDGGYLAANPAWLRLHGFQLEDLEGHTSVTRGVWLSAEDREEMVAVLRREGEVRAMPVKFRARNGDIIEALFYATVIDWMGERAIVAAPQDVTELLRVRREAESRAEEARAASARFEAILEQAPSGITITTRAGGVLRYVNPAWSAMFGLQPHQALGRTVLEVRVWASEEKRRAFIAPLIARGESIRGSRTVRTLDGRVLDILNSALPIEYAGEQCILAIYQDVSELEAARRASHASAERFAKIFGLSPNPVSIGRLSDGVHLEVNPAFSRVLGYAREEVIGRSSIELGIWANPADRRLILERLRRGESVRNAPARLRMKSGEVRDFQFSATLLEWDGEPAVLFIP